MQTASTQTLNRLFDMDWPLHTIDMPKWRECQDRKDWCGAFGALYPVIGNCANGVPETDEAGDTMVGSAAYVEMMIARVRMDYCLRSDNAKRGVSQSTIQEIIDVVDEYLHNNKDFRHVFIK